MNVRASACFVALFLLAGCPEKKDTEEEATATKTAEGDKKTADKNSGTTAAGGGPTPTTPAGGTAATTPTPATTDTAAPPPTAAGITPRVKSEVDNKPDGVTGTKQSISGATAAVQTPKDWVATTKAEPLAFKSPDDKARVALAGFGPEGPDAKIAAAAAAAGLTNCQWSPPEAVTAGKDKLAANVHDGTCTRGAGSAKAAAMAVNGLVVVGSWDEGGDAASVFGVMRSVAKADLVDPLAACCAAIMQNSKSAPPQQVGMYVMAAGACQSARKTPDGRKALAGIRAMLAGASVPSACR